MKITFIDREAELKFLEGKYRERGFQLVVIYGRRRIGKTELIRQFLEGKEGIYYLADKRGTEANAKLFAREAAAFFGDVQPAAESFDDVFAYVARRAGNGRIVVVIDEFSYLVEKDDAIPSVFQKIADGILERGSMMLILCGSSMSMMEKGVLSYKSPLYGRRTGDWKLNRLKYLDAMRFFPRYGLAGKLEAVLLLGGVPAYLKIFDDSMPVEENIRRKILAKGEFLYNEVNVVLQEELRDTSTYLRILDSMSKGASKVVDIANKSYLEAKDIPKYLNVLQKLEYVERIHPVTERRPKSKKTIYRMSDNFFIFWFNYVSAYKSELEIGKIDDVFRRMKKDMGSFLGKRFEDFCREFLSEAELPLRVSRIGTWWGYRRVLAPGTGGAREEIEIDIVGIDEENQEMLFAECKWSDLKEKEAAGILEKLREKSKFVDYERKKGHFGLVARNVLGKENLRKMGYLVWDLEDIGNLLMEKQ